jgi:hypothetical protein
MPSITASSAGADLRFQLDSARLLDRVSIPEDGEFVDTEAHRPPGVDPHALLK